MRICRDPGELPRGDTRSCVALGVFDGVHQGHRVVLGCAVQKAREHGWQAVAVTFHPHPQQVITGSSEPFLLLSLDERLRRMAALGLDAAVVLTFDERLRRTEPEEFVQGVLVDGLRASAVACGPDFQFGRDRRGDVELLRRMGAALGFDVYVCPPVYHAGERVSSSRIRLLLRQGRVEEACALLDQHEVLGCISRDGKILLVEHLGQLGLPKEPVRPGETPQVALWRLLGSLGLSPADVRSVREGLTRAQPQTLELWHPFHVELVEACNPESFASKGSGIRWQAPPYPSLPEGQEEIVRWAVQPPEARQPEGR